VIASADQTDGRLSVLEVSGGRGTMPPLHVHRTDDEVFHVIEGELTAYVGDAVVHLGSGDRLRTARRAPHLPGRERRRPLAHGGRARRPRPLLPGDRAAGRRRRPPPEPIAPDVDAAAELERETGFRIELLGPPGALPRDLT
jgi:hypothetical protein